MILFLVTLLAFFLYTVFFLKQGVVGRQSFLVLVSALLISCFVVFLYTINLIQEEKIVLMTLSLGGSAAATSLLFFAFEYVNSPILRKFSKNLFFLILIEPAISLAVISMLPASDQAAGLIYPRIASLFLFWDYFHNLYIIVILICAIIFVAPGMHLGIIALRRKAGVLLVAFLLPILLIALNIHTLFEPLTLEILVFIASASIIGLVLLRSKTVSLAPFSRNRVVEQMREGWLLLDSENCVVDANPAAKKMLAISNKKRIYGLDAKTIFSPWQNIVRTLEGEQELDAKVSLRVKDEYLYVHIKILHIRNPEGVIIGRLLFLLDHTDTRKSEKARQQARDEMFSLLHSISGAASRSETTIEFITASMYQLASSFFSQSIAIFLKDNESNKEERFLLVAHQGIKSEYLESITPLDPRYEFVSQFLETKKSVLIEDLQMDSQVPNSLRNALDGCLLGVPIIVEDELVGIILLTREDTVYSQNEIVRLESAAEQVGSFVRNDRRRDIASTLAERQRLIRDLHDSVTQRLYALVMTTEIAQLTLKTKRISELDEIVEQLGVHARQAVKEMRLFLHKLQPIDLERDGLVTVLLRRLEAVEGHTDIERDVDIDEDINLGQEDELALFFIAQEALNNIIKHADANLVKIKLKKTKSNVRFEIFDNGHGFDVKNVNQFGLGLKNMYARTKKIGAKLKINSTLEKGHPYCCCS